MTSPRLFHRAAGVLAAGLVLAVARADPPNPARSTLNPVVAQTFAPLLANWITESRDAALEQGVERIPSDIRQALAGYVPEEILDKVRWRTGGGSELSLQQNLFRIGDYEAVTLDYVVVFQDRRKATVDPKLWAHELKHVMQYAQWGVPGFALRYLQDYEAVERDAAEFRWNFMKRAGLIPKVGTGGSD